MIARKCDKCGKFYEEKPVEFQCGSVIGLKLFNRSTTQDTFDLCPDCLEQLRAWLDNDFIAKGSSITRLNKIIEDLEVLNSNPSIYDAGAISQGETIEIIDYLKELRFLKG